LRSHLPEPGRFLLLARPACYRQASDPTEIEPFVEAFLATAHGTTPLTYLSFRLPPATVLDRYRRVWDPERFTLLDGWSGGHDAPAGRRKGATAGSSRRARVRRLKDPADMERLWGPEAALASFLRWCPRLYQERTVAYWLLERDAHPAAFRSRLGDITQVILDLEAKPAERTLRVVKADGHPSGVTGRTLQYVVGEDGCIDALQQASGTRERIGEQVRAGRIAAGLSQAELARRIGVTPSALSQVEQGRHGLSGETLTACGPPWAFPVRQPAPQWRRGMAARHAWWPAPPTVRCAGAG
jgi:DNA-binding XRE family transcriptional regulator